MNYYISPKFLDKLSVHITKNFLNIPGVKMPLILGIHGRKGEGKSFQCELVYERMGVELVHISAGELESPDAGDPARLVRLRYREAAELCKVRGKMAVLMINDLDAGAGRVDQFTQYTVNTQLVNGTLMNIADNPTNVQLPGSYEIEPIQRIPIVVTGNDFSTLYAPLIRDGRMEKFFWEPDRADRIGIVGGIFAGDAIAPADIEKLVDTFPDQAIDFYSAMRSRLYDEQVRQLIQNVGLENISQRVVNSVERVPEFRQPDFSLPRLIETGHLLVIEQQRVQTMRLAEEYNQPLHQNRRLGGTNLRETTSPPSRPEPPSNPSRPQVNEYFTYYGESNQSPAPPNGQPSNSNIRPDNIRPDNISPEMRQEVSRMLSQGHRLGIEYVDERRFRTNSWQGYTTVQGEREAIAALESCLSEHPQHYIRLVSIEPNTRRRITEAIVQRPDSRK